MHRHAQAGGRDWDRRAPALTYSRMGSKSGHGVLCNSSARGRGGGEQPTSFSTHAVTHPSLGIEKVTMTYLHLHR